MGTGGKCIQDLKRNTSFDEPELLELDGSATTVVFQLIVMSIQSSIILLVKAIKYTIFDYKYSKSPRR